MKLYHCFLPHGDFKQIILCLFDFLCCNCPVILVSVLAVWGCCDLSQHKACLSRFPYFRFPSLGAGPNRQIIKLVIVLYFTAGTKYFDQWLSLPSQWLSSFFHGTNLHTWTNLVLMFINLLIKRQTRGLLHCACMFDCLPIFVARFGKGTKKKNK